MQDRKPLILLQKARAVGIGHLTSFTRSTLAKPGYLLGSSKGLFHLEDIKSRARRIRSNPVGYVFSGQNGVIYYEEVKNHGRIAILDGDFSEIRVDTALARTINPKAYWKNGLILLRKDHLEYFDVLKDERFPLVEFPGTRMVGQFAQAGDGFEFIAVLKEKDWPTLLYRLKLENENNPVLIERAVAEDPIFARHFHALPNGNYIVIGQGVPAFNIFRIFDGEKPAIKPWALVSMPEEIHPSGMLVENNVLYLAASDSIVTFGISPEITG